jgi:hypothetical protein
MLISAQYTNKCNFDGQNKNAKFRLLHLNFAFLKPVEVLLLTEI